MNSRLQKTVKNALYTLAMPAAVYLLFVVLTAAAGKTGFGVGADWGVIWRNTIYSGLIALALSYNLTSGRFDFSVGSILILSIILGATAAVQWGLGPLPMLLLCTAIGAGLGAISGLAYVLLRLPPIVVSIGVAMVYEGVAFLLNNGSGVRVLGDPGLLIFASQPYITLLAAAILAILVVLLNFTKFGYDTNSLRSGQAIAVSIGVDEKKNAVICYLIAGALMAVAGVITLSILGSVTPRLGLSSSSYMMNAFLPLFIGTFLARYSERNIGILVGAFTQACIISGFAILELSSSLQSVLNGVIVLLFLVATANSYKLVEMRMLKEKRQRAQQRAQLAAQSAG